MKILLTIVVLSFSQISLALTPADKISEIELNRNAKCIFQNETIQVCLGPADLGLAICRYKQQYVCISNSNKFSALLKIKRVGRNLPKVTKVKYKSL